MNPVNKILFGIGAAVVLAVGITFMWLSLANAYLKTQLAEAQANGTACHMANDAFTAAVVRQNQAVEALKTQGELRARTAQAAVVTARKEARRFATMIDTLNKTKARGDDCQAANALLNNYIESVK